MSCSELLSSSGTDSETERMTNFENFGLQPYSLEPTKLKAPVVSGKNSMSDLDSNNDTAKNDVDGIIDNKTWCKCECCAPMETSIKSVCCLETPHICKPRFSGALCLYVFRSDPYFMLGYSMQGNSINYLSSTQL